MTASRGKRPPKEKVSQQIESFYHYYVLYSGNTAVLQEVLISDILIHLGIINRHTIQGHQDECDKTGFVNVVSWKGNKYTIKREEKLKSQLNLI